MEVHYVLFLCLPMMNCQKLYKDYPISGMLTSPDLVGEMLKFSSTSFRKEFLRNFNQMLRAGDFELSLHDNVFQVFLKMIKIERRLKLLYIDQEEYEIDNR